MNLDLFACATGDHELNNDYQYDQEEVVINKILSEGLKLKKKCKILSNQLAESENLRIMVQEQFAKEMKAKESILQNLENDLKKSFEEELDSVRDTKDKEIQNLIRNSKDITFELNDLKQRNSNLSNKVNNLTDEIDQLKKHHVYEISCLRQEYETEKRAVEMKRQDTSDEQRSSLIRRAMLAESEVEKLTEMIAVISSKNKMENATHYGQAQEIKEERRRRDEAERDLTQARAHLDNLKEENKQLLLQKDELMKEKYNLLSKIDEMNYDINQISVLRSAVQDRQIVLLRAKDEIENLRKRVEELTKAKDSVETAVREVMEENEELNKKLKSIEQ
jgi:chromosome segregation ATPase